MLFSSYHFGLMFFFVFSAVGDQGYWVLAASAVPATLYMLFGYKTHYKKTESELQREKEDDVSIIYCINLPTKI